MKVRVKDCERRVISPCESGAPDFYGKSLIGEGCSLTRRMSKTIGVITRTMMTRRAMSISRSPVKVDADVPSGKGQPRVERQVCLHLFHWLLSYGDIFSVGPSTYVERRRQSITSLEEDYRKCTDISLRFRLWHSPLVQTQNHNLYISFANLRSYVEVNYSGFRKITTKFTYSDDTSTMSGRSSSCSSSWICYRREISLKTLLFVILNLPTGVVMWYLLPFWTSVVKEKRLIDVFLSCLCTILWATEVSRDSSSWISELMKFSCLLPRCSYRCSLNILNITTNNLEHFPCPDLSFLSCSLRP